VGVFYDDRIQEVLVQMVYVLEDTVLQKGANTYVVEYREELHLVITHNSRTADSYAQFEPGTRTPSTSVASETMVRLNAAWQPAKGLKIVPTFSARYTHSRGRCG
jgi:hypothetical protein